MEVLKSGKFGPTWKKQVVCENCGAILKISVEDLREQDVIPKSAYVLDMRIEHGVVCTCIECGHMLLVEVSTDIKNLLRKINKRNTLLVE